MSRSASGWPVGGQQQEILGEQRLDHEFGVVDREVHDRRVQLPGEHVGHERRGRTLLHDHAYVGVALAEPVQEAGDQPAGGGADHADAGLARHVGVAARHVGGDVVDLVEDASGPLDDPCAVLGQSALGAVDERDAELLLEPGDVARDVRLHRVERPGRR